MLGCSGVEKNKLSNLLGDPREVLQATQQCKNLIKLEHQHHPSCQQPTNSIFNPVLKWKSMTSLPPFQTKRGGTYGREELLGGDFHWRMKKNG